ncbi:MAG: hypothetical protein AAF634_08115, partial [Bacteroidota bacterium]
MKTPTPCSALILTLLFFVFPYGSEIRCQSDTLVFDSGNKMIGEIKKMEKGVLEIDAPYGDENFKVKWLNIKEIYTTSKFVVSIADEL